MSSHLINDVRKGFYLDSVALMRMSREIAAGEGVEEAALMMGTPANLEIMSDAGLLDDLGAAAGGGDLIIAVRANSADAARAAMTAAEAVLDKPTAKGGDAAAWRPKTLRSAVAAVPTANLALISVPGAFAVAEARKAIRRGLHAMIFSDNVPLDQEIELKREARELNRLVMGPDCGTAIIAGTPLAFANVVPKGPIGVIGASGTGIQEVTTLIARLGKGISHAIGVGGRDLKSEVGGITTLMAIDALVEDTETESLLIVGKPPGDDVAKAVVERLATSGKPAVVCFMGAGAMHLPPGIQQAFTLQQAAAMAAGEAEVHTTTPAANGRAGGILGLYSGGTLCAEAQVILRDAGQGVMSNAAISGVRDARSGECVILDLGDDEFTQGKPHPMIDPSVRDAPLIAALGRSDLSALLVDVVIGYGAHDDPAGHLSQVLATHMTATSPAVFCAVTGTEDDPQRLSAQSAKLTAAGVHVAPCNADAVRWALAHATEQ